jgi:hypothetical protein
VQIIWAQSQGPEKQYGVQSAIVAAVFFMAIFLQLFGPRLRAMQVLMNFKTQ